MESAARATDEQSRLAMRRALIALALAGCASQGFPPGGPADPDPPVLLGTNPDSGAVNVPDDREVTFQFNEVVSERPSGAVSLEGLVLVSPREGEPRVNWGRTRIGVRANRDWRPNTVYTVTLLPGVQDLRNNVRRSPSTIVFSTGSTLPDTRLAGVIYDWVADRPAGGALVEAVTPDSVVYVGAADSIGQFALLHLPTGTYRVRGYLDLDRNREFGPREPFDSSVVQLVDTASLEFYAFVHDSLGPRIENVTARDSITLRVTFDRALAPGQVVDTSRFHLVREDSTRVPVMSARLSRPEALAVRADTTRRPAIPLPPVAPADTADTTAATQLRPRRQPPPTEVILQVFPPLEPTTTYVLTARDLRNLLGNAATSRRSFTTGRRAAPPSVDSLRGPPVSVPRSPSPPNR